MQNPKESSRYLKKRVDANVSLRCTCKGAPWNRILRNPNCSGRGAGPLAAWRVPEGSQGIKKNPMES